MQTTFEVAKLFHFHTCETKINLLLRLKIQTKSWFVLFFLSNSGVVASIVIFIFSRNARFFRKKRLKTREVQLILMQTTF